MAGEICGDNRFEIIEKAKTDLLNKTNVLHSVNEMLCLDSFLYRAWQMGWLKQYETERTDNGTKDRRDI